MEGVVNVMGKYVYYEETPYNKGKYVLALHHDEFPFHNGTSGSYNVFLARIAGLSYADFLRMCRDEFGATIIGKNALYPVAYFDFGEGLSAITKWLDTRAKFLVYRYNHPYEIEKTEGYIIKRYDNGEVEQQCL